RRAQDGPDQRRRLQPLPAAAPQRQGHRRGDGFAQLHRDRGGGEPAACAEGRHGRAGRAGRGQRGQRGPGTGGRGPVKSRVPVAGPGARTGLVLACSGGLDTSYCVPYLQERGWTVQAVFADTGGVDADEREFIEKRAAALGVASHVTVDGGPALWSDFGKPFG